MKKKLHLGKTTLRSIEFQITTILASLNQAEVRIDRMKPVRYDTGNFIFVTYHTAAEPGDRRSRFFAHQKIGDCCDVWLESPPEQTHLVADSNAA